MPANESLAVMAWRPSDTEMQDGPASLAGLPPVLTVEEAARVLRIGRRLAYEQARIYLATDGAEGLPVVRLGRTLRVPTVRLVELLRARPQSETAVARPLQLAPFHKAR